MGLPLVVSGALNLTGACRAKKPNCIKLPRERTGLRPGFAVGTSTIWTGYKWYAVTVQGYLLQHTAPSCRNAIIICTKHVVSAPTDTCVTVNYATLPGIIRTIRRLAMFFPEFAAPIGVLAINHPAMLVAEVVPPDLPPPPPKLSLMTASNTLVNEIVFPDLPSPPSKLGLAPPPNGLIFEGVPPDLPPPPPK